MRSPIRWPRAILVGVTVAGAVACREATGRLGPERLARFTAEGVLRRADDLEFRFTEGGGRRGGRWEERVASIIITGQSVFIHKNEKVGLELTPRTRRDVEVRPDGERIRITAGTGRSAESWSFVP